MRSTVSAGTPWGDIVSYSRAVRVGSMIVVSGTTATGVDGMVLHAGEAGPQTRVTLQKIEKHMPTRYRRASEHGFLLYGVFTARFSYLAFAVIPHDRLPLFRPQLCSTLGLGRATEQNRLQEEVFSEAGVIVFHHVIDSPVRFWSANSLR